MLCGVNTLLGTRRLCALTLSALVVALAPVVAAPGAATASTGEMHQCTTPEIRNGKTMRRITLRHQEFRLTHAELRRIPRGVRFSRKVTMTKVTVLSASIRAAATIKAEENAWFEKASVEASVSVAGSGRHTSKTSVTEKFMIPESRHDREFAFFEGRKDFAFQLHKRTCHLDGQKDFFGKLQSFSNVPESGAVLCPRSRYKQGSEKFQIALQSGC